MMRLSTCIIIATCFLTMNTPLLADEGAEGAEDEQARSLFKEGIKLFKEGEYEGASIAFNRAYELRPSYKILYNVGQVESELKHYCRALKAYSNYLKEGGDEIDPERQKEVNSQIERMKIFVGDVEIRYGEDGVTVLIDEERYGVTPMESAICVDMGNHDLSLRKGVQEIYRESFRIAGGKTLTLNLETAEEPPPAAAVVETEEPETSEEEPPAETSQEKEPKPPAATPEETEVDTAPKAAPPEKKKRKWTWVTLGVGAAFGAAGAIVGGISMSKESKLESRCNDYQCSAADKGEGDAISSMNLTADILYGTAAACGVAALVLFFMEPKIQEKNVAVTPGFSPQSVGVAVTGRF